MSERFIYKAPERAETTEPTIFLAGPIQGARDWQEEAIGIIHFLHPDVVITSPRRDVFGTDPEAYDQQVDWESDHLSKAGRDGVVMFWLERESEPIPGRSYAQTTRFELGEWFTKHKTDGSAVVVGIDEGFTNARYIRKRLSQEAPEIPILDSLGDTCVAAINFVKANLRKNTS